MEHIRRYEYNLEILQTIGGYDITRLGLKAIDLFDPKHHTIRAGHRFKAGDWFSPRVWSGKPYNSKQIQFAPDIQVKNVWDFDAHGTDFFLSGKHEFTHPEGFDFSEVEKNDGLSACELMDWICMSPEFKKTNTFAGQIICWDESIEY